MAKNIIVFKEKGILFPYFYGKAPGISNGFSPRLDGGKYQIYSCHPCDIMAAIMYL